MSFRLTSTINAINYSRLFATFCTQIGVAPTGSTVIQKFATRPFQLGSPAPFSSMPSDQMKRRPQRKYRTPRKQEYRKEIKEEISFTKHKEDDLPQTGVEPTVSYSPDQLVPGCAMLQRIVSDLAEKGTTFILPNFEDDDVIGKMTEPFRKFIGRGVRPEFLISACVASPELFKNLTIRGESSFEIISFLSSACEMTVEDSIRFFSSYGDSLLDVGADGVSERLDSVVRSGVPPGKALGRVVRRCAAVSFARSAEEMGRATEALADFFSRKEISGILQKCPQILLMSIEEVEEKYEYIYYQMCIDGSEFPDCSNWAMMSLDEIMCRHEFLLKCGKYTTPDPKKPQAKMQNPELHRILDSTDDHFAIQVAGVTREEWIVYRALSAKWAELAVKDRPFERVKPSMRKAFERRRKEIVEREDHVFGDTAHVM